MTDIDVPSSRDEFFPPGSIPLTPAVRVLVVVSLLGIVVLGFPALSVPDEPGYDTTSSDLDFNYQTSDGETEYGTVQFEALTLSTGLSPGETIRPRMTVAWQGYPYGQEVDSSLTVRVRVALVFAPASWSDQRAAEDGTILLDNIYTVEKGNAKDLSKNYSIPEGFEASGIGPDKAKLYYLVEVDGTNQRAFQSFQTYTVARPFWSRPGVYIIFMSLLGLTAAAATKSEGFRNEVRRLGETYAERRWQRSLHSAARQITVEFDNHVEGPVTPPAEVSGPIQEDRSSSELKTAAERLVPFAVLVSKLSDHGKSQIDTVVNDEKAEAKVWEAGARAYQDGDVERGKALSSLINAVSGNEYQFKFHGETYSIMPFIDSFGAPLEEVKTDRVDTLAKELVILKKTTATIETFGQPRFGASGKYPTSAAAVIDGDFVEPRSHWTVIEEAIEAGDYDAFTTCANRLDELVEVTAPLRPETGEQPHGLVDPTTVDHVIAKGEVPNHVCTAARTAIEEGDPDSLRDILTEAEGRKAAEEITAILDSTNLEHTAVDAGDLRERINEAKAKEDWEEVLNLKDHILTRVDAAWSLSDMLNLSPTQFEEIVGVLYAQHGYGTEVTKQSGDRGVDVIATKGQETVAIQAKRYHPQKTGKVSGPEVRKSIGATVQLGADVCVVATTSGFTSEAKVAARDVSHIRVDLVDGKELIRQLSDADVPTPK